MREDEIWQQALAHSEVAQPKYVQHTFFITEDEAKSLRENTGDGYITHELPHYILHDATIMYGKSGWSTAKEVWWDIARKK